MYYDDTSRRLNLISGLVFGAALGAGLALLFASEVPADGGRVVVRAAREGLDAARERLSGGGRTTRLARKRFEL